MSNNYIKIELSNSIPYISMEYDNLDSFKSLVFFMISEIGSSLFIKTIQSELVQENKSDELLILKEFAKIIAENKDEKLIINRNDTPVINPSAFK